MARTDSADLLVIEDEPDIGSLLEHVLNQAGFRVRVATTGERALSALNEKWPDLVVLDLMLPDMSGLDILRKLRRDSGSAVRRDVLSAKQDEADRLKGFELGADDYVPKPFSPRELIVRVRKALNQTAAEGAPQREKLSAGPIEVDPELHEVRVNERPVHLTLTEFRLLTDMLRNAGRVRSRSALMTEVWDYDSQAMSRTIDTHVRRLRAKLGPAAAWIDTVRGVGYRLRDPEA